MTEITKWQAEALAQFINGAVRPDWSVAGIVSALGEARTMADASDLAIAAIVAARTPTNRTPGVLALPGPHWGHTAQRRHASAHTTPARSRTCGVCYLDFDRCRARWSADHDFESLDDIKQRRIAAADTHEARLSRQTTAGRYKGRPVEDVDLL